MSCIIKEATLADVPLLCKLGADIFYESYAVFNTEEDMQLYMQETYSEKTVAIELSDNAAHFFIAYLDNEPVGYVKMSDTHQQAELKEKKHFEIERLYVYAYCQGRGIGYALIDICIATGKAQGFNALWLGVWEHNSNAISFYKKVGLSVFGKHLFRLGNDLQTDLLMMLDLSSR